MMQIEFDNTCLRFISCGHKPTIPEVEPLVLYFLSFPENIVGGVLHVVLDDANVDDATVDFCKDMAVAQGDMNGLMLARVIRLCSKTQRRKLAKAKRREA